MFKAILIVLTAIITAYTISFAATIHVPGDYPTIQEAIDAAVSGDTVLVKPGTYVEKISFLGKAITLLSEQGAGVTSIDGTRAGSVVTCHGGEGSDTVFDGFTVINGSKCGMSNSHSNPTVTNCTFTGNTASSGGGGMRNVESNPTVTNCTFTGNSTAYYGGGGMSNLKCSPTVTNCTFTENSATYYGGGMYNSYGNPTVTNCTFFGNNAFLGGGMANSGSDPTVTNCTFTGNTAFDEGGGMANSGCSTTVTNCNFAGNSAVNHGGGIYNAYSNHMVTNCTFSENSASAFSYGYGGGIYNLGGYQTVTNCTFTGNIAFEDGGGMLNSGGSTTVTNCILWNNQPNQVAGPATVTFCCIQGGSPGTGNIDSYPFFADETNGDFHLTINSPCRGSGDNSAVTELYDFEGDPRIYQGTVDMGADEFYTHLYVTGDKTPGGSIEGKFVGLPGMNPVGLFIGSSVLPSPIPTMWGEYWLQAPWVLLGPLGPIPGNGVMVLPTTLPPGMTVPVDIPMQALIGLNADSLTNLELLEVR